MISCTVLYLAQALSLTNQVASYQTSCHNNNYPQNQQGYANHSYNYQPYYSYQPSHQGYGNVSPSYQTNVYSHNHRPYQHEYGSDSTSRQINQQPNVYHGNHLCQVNNLHNHHRSQQENINDQVPYYQGQDACQHIANEAVVDHEKALNCYRMFPFNRTAAYNTLDTLSHNMTLSALLSDVSKNGYLGPLGNYNLDSKSFISDFDFNLDLSKHFKQFQESHTVYSSLGYSTFKFQLPLGPYIVVENNRPLVYLKALTTDPALTKKWKESGLDSLYKYENKKVIKIQNQPALQYLQNYANKFVGKSRNINNRLHLALTQMETQNKTQTITPGLFANPELNPEASKIKFLFENESELEVEYLAINPRGYTNKDTFKNNKFSFPQTSFTLTNQPISTPGSGYDPNNILFEGTFMSAYKLCDSTVVLRVYSFMTNRSNWRVDLDNLMDLLKNPRWTKILIDVRNNSQGSFCSAKELVEYFFPKAANEMFESYYSTSQELKDLGNKFSNEQYREALRTVNTEALEENDQLAKFIKENVTSNCPYTDFVPNCGAFRVYNSFRDSHKIAPENISLLTDGGCLTGCALFSHWIAEKTTAKTYYLGKFTSTENALVGSSIGGVPSSNQALLPTAGSHHLHPFSAGTDFIFPFMGFFSTQNRTPLDLANNYANHIIPYTRDMIFNPRGIWERVYSYRP